MSEPAISFRCSTVTNIFTSIFYEEEDYKREGKDDEKREKWGLKGNRRNKERKQKASIKRNWKSTEREERKYKEIDGMNEERKYYREERGVKRRERKHEEK